MKFTKAQGTGNDFILVETDHLDQDWASQAKAMCERRFGIGADGLILVFHSDKADIGMCIFNSDGSEAEMCGNGIRCLARYAVERGLVMAGTKQISVDTRAGIRHIKLEYESGKLAQIQVDMGKPGLKPDEIPVKLKSLDITPVQDHALTIAGKKLSLSFVSMGNPHAVYFTDEKVSAFPLSEIGPKVEHHEMFPNRINFEIARVLSRNKIEARVWERGAGETLACGTGACAIAVSARLHGFIDDIVDIMLPGGILSVDWGGVGEVLMSGPAELVFTGEWLKS